MKQTSTEYSVAATGHSDPFTILHLCTNQVTWGTPKNVPMYPKHCPLYHKRCPPGIPKRGPCQTWKWSWTPEDMKKSFNQFDEEKRLPLKFKNYWMTPSCFPVIVIILMSDRGMLLGVPGGLCLGYRGDSVWSTRGTVFGVQWDVFWGTPGH